MKHVDGAVAHYTAAAAAAAAAAGPGLSVSCLSVCLFHAVAENWCAMAVDTTEHQ